MTHQLHCYLNDDKKIDDFIIQNLRTTKTGFSNLVRALLYIYFKHGTKDDDNFETADFVKLVDARLMTKER